MSDDNAIFVMTFEYFDRSAFHVCGVTLNPAVANAWRAAGDGQHKVYRCFPDVIQPHSTGYEEWR